MTKRFLNAFAWLPAAAIVAAAGFVQPEAVDAFETPKHLIWGVLAATFAAALCLAEFCAVFLGRNQSCRHQDLRKTAVPFSAFGIVLFFGASVLAWMVARTAWSGTALSQWAAPLLAWTTPLVLFLLFMRLPPNIARLALRHVSTILTVVGVVEACLMLLQRFGMDPLFGESTAAIPYLPGRMIGTVGYQNQAAEFLGVAFFALLCIKTKIGCVVGTLHCEHGTSRRARFVSVCVFVAASVVLIAMLASANRGALVGLFVAPIGLWIAREVHSRKVVKYRTLMRIFLVVVALVGVALSVPETRRRFSELLHPGDSVAVQSRALMSRAALAMVRDYPTFGSGAGGFSREYIDRLGTLLPNKPDHSVLRNVVWARETHCDPLQFFAEFGFVGVVLLSVFVLATLRLFRGSIPFAAATFLAVCSLFSFSWQTSLAAPSVGLWLGLWASGNRPPETQEQMSTCRRVCSFLLSLFLLATAVGNATAARFLEDENIAGQTTALDPDGPRAVFERIVALEADGRWDEAINESERLVRSGIVHAEALRVLSVCYEHAARTAEAADTEAERFRLCGSEFPDGDVFRMAALFLMSGNAERAEYFTRKFKERCKRHDLMERWTPEFENLRGGALMSLGRFDEAEASFTAALERNPSLISARRNLDAVAQMRRTPENREESIH